MIVPRHQPRPAWEYPLAQFPATFATDGARRVLIEVGPGRGDFLFHLATQHPDAVVCGIEIKRKRFSKLIERRARKALENITLILGDAREALPTVLDRTAVDVIYIQFPDPWPKRRHAWHRLVDQDFLACCHQRLRSGGAFWFVTDHQPYAESVAALVQGDAQWTHAFPTPIVTDCPDAYPTFFAEKWRAQGRTIYYQQYRKN